MKIMQDKTEFEPITIVLETTEEAELIWNAIETYPKMKKEYRDAALELCNWFSNHAKL